MSLFELPSLTFQPLRYRYRGVADWSGHVPFARDLIEALEPRLLVELGTHYGESYFSFCQAIQEQGCDTKAFAVDTWQGDIHTGRYGEEVFEDVGSYNHSHYESFSTLLRMQFDHALERFENQSIDLLHIDGVHEYEAVRRDFQTWLPKVAAGGIILFHDIAVRHNGFGVWRLWQELQQMYSSFQFDHSAGLGVLQLPGTRKGKGILETLFTSTSERQLKIQRYYQMCSEHLNCQHDQKVHWDIVSQLFWRSDNEDFSENRSMRTASTLTTYPSTINLKAPASSRPCELRANLTNRDVALRVFKVSLRDEAGSTIWELKGDDFFRTMKHAGLVHVEGGDEGSLVVVAEDDCAILIPLPEGSENAASVVQFTIELSGVSRDEAFRELTGRLNGLTASLGEIRHLLQEREQELRRYDAGLGEGQRVAEERGRTIEELRDALGRAEVLLQEREQELRRYDAGLGEAQRVAEERGRTIEELRDALGRAEVLVQEREQELRRYDAGLGEAQRVAEERGRTIEELRDALGRAEVLMQEREQELRRYDTGLGEAQRIAEERKQLVAQQELKIQELAGLLRETGTESERVQASLRSSQVALQQALAEIQKMEHSLSWRLSRPIRALEGLASSMLNRS